MATAGTDDEANEQDGAAAGRIGQRTGRGPVYAFPPLIQVCSVACLLSHHFPK